MHAINSFRLKYIRLTTPLSLKKIRRLSMGDIVMLTGDIFICRDRAHRRIVNDYLGGKKSKDLPFSLKNQVIFHTGPIMRKRKGKWTAVLVGSTTSMKLESVEYLLIDNFKLRAIIGKGGMGRKTTAAMRRQGCIYLATVGGAAALLTKGVKKVMNKYWLEDFGVTEAVWHLKVKDFGPLIVGIDSHGRNLYEENKIKVLRKYEKLFPRH